MYTQVNLAFYQITMGIFNMHIYSFSFIILLA